MRKSPTSNNSIILECIHIHEELHGSACPSLDSVGCLVPEWIKSPHVLPNPLWVIWEKMGEKVWIHEK